MLELFSEVGFRPDVMDLLCLCMSLLREAAEKKAFISLTPSP